MLRLKEVELLGFKSFADRTRLVCDSTTAAVVGPNGCGKSNLSDAVSWVLGEQSARMLRGERMSDVIFNGTSMRPPTGLAEVSMTLVEMEEAAAASDELERVIGVAAEVEQGLSEGGGAEEVSEGGGAAAARAARPPERRPGDEIKVTRRLFRSGESEYLLNGEECRLRDIQDIFRGTGLGPESYAIIEQGRIGQILSSKPSDRRLIIEEAAGVSKFKSRKRLAEAKLESSRENLSRINDILEEVSKQVNSLKRQASKAERHRELREGLRSRQRLAVASRLAVLDAECARWRADLAAIQHECSAASSNVTELESSRNLAASEYERIEEDLKMSREELAANELESERTGRRLDHLRQQAVALEARHAEAEAERLRLSGQAQALDVEAGERQAHAAEVRAEWVAAQEAAADLSERRAELAQSLAEHEALAEERRQAALAAVSRASEIRNESVKAEEMALSASRELARVEAERAAAEAERNSCQSALAAAQMEQQRNEEALRRLGEAAEQARATLEIERASERALRAEVERLGEEFARAAARRNALEESLARHAYSTDSVRGLLSASNSETGGFRALGVMADFVEVSPGFETPVEELLRADLDRVVVSGYDEARGGIALLEREKKGRCAFFVLNAPALAAASGTRPELAGRHGVVAALSEMVRCDARLGMSGTQAFPALARSFLAESPAAAERLAAEFPSFNFITRDGELYHGRCVSGGKTSSGGPLALRRDFRELERRTFELEKALENVRSEASAVQARVLNQDEALRRLDAERLKLEKEASLAGEKVRQGEELVARCETRIGTCRNEASRLNAERGAAEELCRSLETQEAAAQRGKEEYGTEAAAAAAAARRMRLVLDEAGTALAASQMKSSALEERWKAAESDRVRVWAEAAAARDRLAHLATESDQWRAEHARLEADAAGAEAHLSEARLIHESICAQVQASEEESRRARGRRDELAPQVDAARSNLDALREKRGGIEVAQARAAAGLEHNSQQCQEELGVNSEALRSETPAGDLLEGEALELAEADVRALKEKIERLGPVNMMALEELREASERLTFLDTQRQDLLASIEDTTQSIREIDAVSRRKFLDAFAAINGFFSESFRSLFGGGAAEMRFSDEADPDSGIDLVVQPPGKRLQNVLLLSGGEKALTALALLIAVFRYSPSPFCILDEVDAPLDEANVVRFARMIQKLSEQTQFIIITHNKRTMEACPMIYGVTMEEAGVSRLVSVRFGERVPEPVEVSA